MSACAVVMPPSPRDPLRDEGTLDELIAQGGSADPAANDEFGGTVGRIINLEGRMYPVDVLYLETPAEDYVEKAVQTVFDIHTREPDGDILVFLTGREEIERDQLGLRNAPRRMTPVARPAIAA